MKYLFKPSLMTGDPLSFDIGWTASVLINHSGLELLSNVKHWMWCWLKVEIGNVVFNIAGCVVNMDANGCRTKVGYGVVRTTVGKATRYDLFRVSMDLQNDRRNYKSTRSQSMEFYDEGGDYFDSFSSLCSVAAWNMVWLSLKKWLTEGTWDWRGMDCHRYNRPWWTRWSRSCLLFLTCRWSMMNWPLI